MSIRQGGKVIAGSVGQYPLNEKNITNCITYIPQDIKLELNNGTLTLKAGSKVYVPNGAGVFNELTITNDLVSAQSTATFFVMAFVMDNNSVFIMPVNQCYSGSSAPTLSPESPNAVWFDTTNGIIKKTSNGSTWTNTLSLPLCVYTPTGSIYQVFNGFGYIGSTVFVLPGVKGLIPSGRHWNGTLYNPSFTINEVHTATFSGTTSCTTLALSASGWIGESTNYSYAEDINYNIWGGDKSDIQNILLFGKCKLSSGVISNFSTNTTFHAVDYNDTEYMAHQAMPGNRYIDLTLGASGATYKAPADGYFMLKGQTTTATNLAYGLFNISAASVGTLLRINANGVEFRAFTIASKGQTARVIYEAALNNVEFRFIYANGAQ